MGKWNLNIGWTSFCVIGNVSTYLGKWGKRVNFGNTVAEIQQKYEREREKVGERKFWISVMWLPKFLLPETEKKKIVAIVAMPLLKMEGKKIVVVEIWGGIKKKKVLHSQYFYNIFTTNHRWLVIISLNLNLILRLFF